MQSKNFSSIVMMMHVHLIANVHWTIVVENKTKQNKNVCEQQQQKKNESIFCCHRITKNSMQCVWYALLAINFIWYDSTISIVARVHLFFDRVILSLNEQGNLEMQYQCKMTRRFFSLHLTDYFILLDWVTSSHYLHPYANHYGWL